MVMSRMLYNPELDRVDKYVEVWTPELVDIKDEKNILVVNHYWKDSDGELWGDFTKPMENIHRGFDAYRKRKNYLTPKEISSLRKKMGLSVRKFADALGISSSALTQIENNHRLQTKYQEVLFRSVKDNPEKFLESISSRKEKTPGERYSLKKITYKTGGAVNLKAFEIGMLKEAV